MNNSFKNHNSNCVKFKAEKNETHAVELIASVVQSLTFNLVVLVGMSIELADIVYQIQTKINQYRIYRLHKHIIRRICY